MDVTAAKVGRRRRIWACSECRRRKLQCDRSRPRCKRCMKAGRASLCSYIDPVETSMDEGSPSQASTQSMPAGFRESVPLRLDTDGSLLTTETSSNLALLESRVANIESNLHSSALAQPRLVPTEDPAEVWNGTRKDSNSNVVFFRGTSFRTKFYGSSFSGSIAGLIPGLHSFTEDAFKLSNTLERIRQAVNEAESRNPLTAFATAGSSIDALLDLLPTKEEADRLVDTYMDSVDHVYHVLHRPTFDGNYAELWTNPGMSEPQNVIMVLLVIAIADCLTGSSGDNSVSSQSRDRAIKFLEFCGTWLQAKAIRYDDIRDFQIQFLLLLGNQLSARRYKRTWVNAGGLLRVWMCVGLHREVTHPRSITPLDREMRKRLWFAAAEFELQSAFEHGMYAQSWPLQSDVQPVGNILDSDMQQNGLGRPTHGYTPSTYLAIAGESLRFRHQLNENLNAVNQVMNFEQTKACAERLLTFGQAIPKWTGSHPTIIHALLSLNLQQYLLVLYQQRLQNTSSTLEKQFLRGAIIDTASKMVDCHKAALGAGSQIMELLCGDHVRIALSLCHAQVLSDPTLDSMITTFTGSLTSGLLEELVTLAGNKVKYFGGDRRHFWYICAAVGLVQSSKEPEKRDTYLQEAVDRFAEPYTELLKFPRGAHGVDAAITVGLPTSSSDTVLYPIRDDMMDWALEDWADLISEPTY